MKTAMETGIAKNDILITQNGNKVEVTKNYVKINGKVTAGETLVDGLGIGDIGSAVIKDRQQLSQDGIVVVAYTIERDRKSTRLNSSHANISYAVFCLKKKK